MRVKPSVVRRSLNTSVDAALSHLGTHMPLTQMVKTRTDYDNVKMLNLAHNILLVLVRLELLSAPAPSSTWKFNGFFLDPFPIPHQIMLQSIQMRLLYPTNEPTNLLERKCNHLGNESNLSLDLSKMLSIP